VRPLLFDTAFTADMCRSGYVYPRYRGQKFQMGRFGLFHVGRIDSCSAAAHCEYVAKQWRKRGALQLLGFAKLLLPRQDMTDGVLLHLPEDLHEAIATAFESSQQARQQTLKQEMGRLCGDVEERTGPRHFGPPSDWQKEFLSGGTEPMIPMIAFPNWHAFWRAWHWYNYAIGQKLGTHPSSRTGTFECVDGRQAHTCDVCGQEGVNDGRYGVTNSSRFANALCNGAITYRGDDPVKITLASAHTFATQPYGTHARSNCRYLYFRRCGDAPAATHDRPWYAHLQAPEKALRKWCVACVARELRRVVGHDDQQIDDSLDLLRSEYGTSYVNACMRFNWPHPRGVYFNEETAKAERGEFCSGLPTPELDERWLQEEGPLLVGSVRQATSQSSEQEDTKDGELNKARDTESAASARPSLGGAVKQLLKQPSLAESTRCATRQRLARQCARPAPCQAAMHEPTPKRCEAKDVAPKANKLDQEASSPPNASIVGASSCQAHVITTPADGRDPKRKVPAFWDKAPRGIKLAQRYYKSLLGNKRPKSTQ
jgi:hypothetical protein